jgi:APA family basic amino acid/polyamine antiporter
MMVFLPLDTWIRLIVWMMAGIDLYLLYGMRHSHLNKGIFTKQSYKTVSFTGVALTVILVIVALLHHFTPEADDTALYYFSMGFAVLHFIFYAITSTKGKRTAM